MRDDIGEETPKPALVSSLRALVPLFRRFPTSHHP